MHASRMPHTAATLLVILALVRGAAPLLADEPATLDLSQARVLASPGWPAALEGFLPPGRTVEPLVVPLPKGPVLVLGLWDADPAARELGGALGLVPREGLGGGYVVDVALVDGQPRAVLLAQDAAALVAGRFELETFTPEARAGAPRSLDMTQPNEQAGVRSAVGRRAVRPRYRIRGLGGNEDGGSPLELASAHANRLWLQPDKPRMEGRPSSFAQLAEHGIVPVALARLRYLRGVKGPPVGDFKVSHLFPVATLDPVQRAANQAQSAIHDLLAWQSKGVRHFALELTTHEPPEDALQRRIDALIVRRTIQALRPGGLEELLVIPPRGSAPATWPDMSGIPEVLVGWHGPTGRDLVITREQAARVACEARVPVVLIETWMADVWYLPSLPRGREEDLGDELAGVVVLPGLAAIEALATAWAPGAPEPSTHPALAELLACCAAEPADAEEFLQVTATNLEQALAGRFADPLWLRQLPERLRYTARMLPYPHSRILARTVETAPVIDGVLEPAWEQAPVTRVGPAEVRALSDGRTLTLSVRVPEALGVSSVEVHPNNSMLEGFVRVDLARDTLALTADPPHAARRVGTAWELEISYGHYTVGGDPHPGQMIYVQVEVATPSQVFRLARLEAGAMSASRPGAVIVVR